MADNKQQQQNPPTPTANVGPQIVPDAAEKLANKAAVSPEPKAPLGLDASSPAMTGEPVPTPNDIAAGMETMRLIGEGMMRSARRNAQSVTDAHHHAIRGAAEQFQKMGSHISGMIQDTAEDVQTLMPWSSTSSDRRPDMTQSIVGVAENVIQSYSRAAQDLYRFAGPGAYVEVQHRFARECADAFMQGGIALMRASQDATHATFKPLEQRIARRQGTAEGNGPGRETGRVTDFMRKTVTTANPEDTVQQVARIMREEDVGALPVGEGDRLVGMVTDRDVALRLVAAGKDPAVTRVRDVMTSDVHFVFEDEDLDRAVVSMSEHNLQRLPIVTRDKRLVGILSVRDLARGGQAHQLGDVMGGRNRSTGKFGKSAA